MSWTSCSIGPRPASPPPMENAAAPRGWDDDGDSGLLFHTHIGVRICMGRA